MSTRPKDLRDHHRRALVLLAAAPAGLHVTVRTTGAGISSQHVGFLQRRGLISVVWETDRNGQRAHITAEGRELLAEIHAEGEVGS